MLREEFISKIGGDETVLEIGPFFRPLSKGDNVRYFDILSKDELIDRAIQIKQEGQVDNIPHIDFVSKIGDLSVVDGKFDAIISCHVIEHQLNLINHLILVSNLLNEGGKYYLVIPDKRYCFDHFNNESTIADIINGAYVEKEKHSIKSVIEHRALTTHNDARRHWNGDHGDITNNVGRVRNAIAEFKTGDYIDVHAWYLTPNSFEIIINTLKELNLIDLTMGELYPTMNGTFEFYVTLNK